MLPKNNINYLNRGAQGIDIVALGIDFVAVRAWAQSVCRLEHCRIFCRDRNNCPNNPKYIHKVLRNNQNVSHRRSFLGPPGIKNMQILIQEVEKGQDRQ